MQVQAAAVDCVLARAQSECNVRLISRRGITEGVWRGLEENELLALVVVLWSFKRAPGATFVESDEGGRLGLPLTGVTVFDIGDVAAIV